ncbi:MAG TPA: hypothetical protein VI197_23855 [Polyangiaceae bacterium]
MTAVEIVTRWTEVLRVRGFDLVQSFDAASYNRSPRALGSSFRLPEFALPKPLGIVIAHGAALWQVLRAAVREDARLCAAAHPLDAYTERVVAELQRATPRPSAAFFSHHTDPVIPIQRIADVAGLAGLSPSHLSVHPRVGPWLGLRAVVVFAEQYSGESEPVLERPCARCPGPCLGPFQRAVDAPEAAWQRWLAVRDSCPVGRDARYDELQIRYHYTKDLSLLRGDPPPTH